MTINKVFYISLLTLLLASCGGSRKAPQGQNPYQRKPITEVSQQQLDIQGLIIDASAKQSIGNNEEALALYRKVLATDPSEAGAWYQAGKIMMQKGWLDSALHYTLQARHLDDSNVWYALQLAHIYDLRHDSRQLVATWEEIIGQHPSVLDYYYNLANTHIKNNDYAKAIEVLDRFEKRYGVSEEVSMQKQRLWGALGKPEKAREELERLAAAAPNETRYNAILAEGYMQEKNYKKALHYYNQILAHNPDDEYIHISLAQCHLLMGDRRNAYSHLRQGLRNPAIDCKTRILYAGEMLRDEKFFAEYSHPLFLLIDTLAADCPPTAGHAYAYGIMLASQERYAEAAVQFRNYLATDSSQYEAWENLMYCVNQTPDHEEELLDIARRATKLFPLHAQPYFIQSRILFYNEKTDEALPLLERLERLAAGKDDLMAETCYMLAECYKSKGDTARAITYYEKVLRIWKDNPYALNSYAYTLAEQGRDLDHAADMAQQALQKMPDDPNILDTYAWILFRQGRCPEALVQMEKAIRNMKEESQTLRDHYDTIKQQCQK